MGESGLLWTATRWHGILAEVQSAKQERMARGSSI